jgi:hypothetical protein
LPTIRCISKYIIKKYNIFLFFVLCPFCSLAQKDTLHLCDSILLKTWKTQYYSYKAKYPLSSEKLAERANREVAYRSKHINGYITIRFIVNCWGYSGEFEIYQIDDMYRSVEFEKEYISQLLTFVKSLNLWHIAKFGKKSVDYYTYLTFKVEYGIITEVVP